MGDQLCSSWLTFFGVISLKGGGVAKQARAAVTRQQIVVGAAKSFGKSGFDGASLSDIVENAGITKGALYFHFRSKDELARVIIEEQHNLSIAAVDAISATDAPAIEQIVMLCHEIARQIVHDPIVQAGIRLTLELSAVEGPTGSYLEGGPVGPYLDWINSCEALIERAVEDGDLLDTVSAPVVARFVISAFTGVQLVSNVLTDREDLEQHLDEMFALLLPSLVPVQRRKKIDGIRAARWSPENVQ